MNIGVKKVTVCFGTNCSITPGCDPTLYEQYYDKAYKPLISTLYNLPEVPFTLFMTGSFIEWIEHRHPEFFMILEEMVARKQIDILGGGYYSPLFPLIPPADRVGQIELLTTSLRRHFGKRPRGSWLTASAWEPSLVSSLTTCGMEYALLDKIMIETSGFAGVDGFTPVTIEDGGKTLTVVPLDNRYRFTESFSPETFFGEMQSIADPSQNRIVVVFMDQSSVVPVFGGTGPSWFESFVKLAGSPESAIELSTAGRYLKSNSLFPRAYLSSGMSPWDQESDDDIRILARTSVKQCLVKSENLLNLYAKMMYVHSLVNQLRGDKSRKKNAREDLWRAQNSEVFSFDRNRADIRRALRIGAYKYLLMAEKSSRVRGVFSPSINAFDFDMDGQKEYLSQLDSLNIYVHPRGGRIFELDILNAYRNYCDLNLSETGLFIDHLVLPEEIDALESDCLPPLKGVFSQSPYQEASLDPGRQEIQLKANGFFGAIQQPVSLRKQYSFRNEGIQVQYILKNDSPLTLSSAFLIELDLSLSSNKNHAPLMAVYAHDNRQDNVVGIAHFNDVSWIQIDDSGAGVKFTIDANENPSVSIFPVLVETGENDRKKEKLDGVRLFLYWKVELGPNFETEKMIFLKIDS